MPRRPRSLSAVFTAWASGPLPSRSLWSMISGLKPPTRLSDIRRKGSFAGLESTGKARAIESTPPLTPSARRGEHIASTTAGRDRERGERPAAHQQAGAARPGPGGSAADMLPAELRRTRARLLGLQSCAGHAGSIPFHRSWRVLSASCGWFVVHLDGKYSAEPPSIKQRNQTELLRIMWRNLKKRSSGP